MELFANAAIMVASRVMIFLVLAVLSVPTASMGGNESPVSKVLSLLSSLEAKITSEGVEAKKVYEEFMEWCEDRAANLKYEIKTGEDDVAELKASIEKATTSIQALTSKIEETAASLSTNEADLKAATSIRAQEESDFAAAEKEMLEVISSLERAIAILERELSKGGASLAQLQKATSLSQALSVMVDASMLQSQDAARLTALMQNSAESDDDLVGAPDAAVYESHSGSIIDTLGDLLDKAKNQLDEARTKETNSKHNFEMLKQSIEDEIKYSTQDLDQAKKDLAATSEGKATAEGDLAVTSKTLAENKDTDSTLEHDCMTKAEEYEAETKSRGEELKALAAAKKVIAEKTGGAADLTYSLNQISSFLQLDQSQLRTSADLANYEAVRFVRNLAQQQHSEALAQLARRMASAIRYGSDGGADPFAKVKSLIMDMIEKLEKDAEADASHKAYCDKEVGETLEKKQEKEYEISKLNTKIDSMSAESTKLKNEVADIQKQLAELASTQAEMDKVRQEEKSLFLKSKPEMEQGLEGIKMALKILREYYASGDGAAGAGQGIIGLLEVVESDFSKTLAEITTDEAASEMAYEQETYKNKIAKTTMDQDVKYKTKRSTQLDTAMAEATSDRESVQTELSAILEYNSQLIEMCVAKPETYDERKGRREAEIAGLKEALSILDGEAVLLQQSNAARRKRSLKHRRTL